MLLCNKSGKIFNVTDLFCELVDIKKDKLLDGYIQKIEFSELNSNHNFYNKLLSQQEFNNLEINTLSSKGITKYLIANKKIINENGDSFILLYFSDISKYKRKISNLEISERNHRILLEESTDPIFSFKEDGTYRYINKAFADPFGKKPDDIIGKKIWDIFSQEEADKRFAVVKEVFKTKKQKEIEVRVPQPEKDLFFLTSVKPIFNNNGDIETVICISKNISDRKYLEQEREEYISKLAITNEKLEFIIKNRDRLFAIIAHDLRSPFNAIINLLSILKNDFNDLTDKEKMEVIKTVNQTSKNTYNLVENLLTWASVQQNEIKFEFEINDICYLINSVLEVIGETINQKELNVLFNCNDEINVLCDKNSIHIVLRNLISNAVKFSPRKSRISISINECESEVNIQIADQGKGIDNEIKDALLSGDKIHTSLGTEGEKGTGLGLMLCKEFVEKNGGRIWFESENGNGTIFNFTLKNHKSEK